MPIEVVYLTLPKLTKHPQNYTQIKIKIENGILTQRRKCEAEEGTKNNNKNKSMKKRKNNTKREI